MDQKIKNSGSRQNRIFEQLAAEKKKTITAICLIAVMAFMWVRVLGGKTGDEAQAALTNTTAANEQSNSEPLKITYIDLPVVKGRNDVLNRDFFAVDDAQLGGGRRADVVTKNGSEVVFKQIAGKIKLEAIVLGQSPRAYVNNKLLTVGDSLVVTEAGNKYEFEVVKIEANKVLIRCGQAEIILKLVQAIEVDG